MQMQVGTFRFEATVGRPEYRELGRRYRRRWATRERHGLPPELEDLGREAMRIDVRGTVWVRESADIEALTALRRAAALEPLAGSDPEVPAPALPVFLGGSEGSSGAFSRLLGDHRRGRDRAQA